MEGKGWEQHYLPVSKGLIGKYIIPILEHYLNGNTLGGYWYIPFVMLTFLIAPVHLLFAYQKKFIQLFVIALFLSISMLVQRPVCSLYFLQYVLYFPPVYLVCITCTIHKEKVYKVMTGKESFLLFFSNLSCDLRGFVEAIW